VSALDAQALTQARKANAKTTAIRKLVVHVFLWFVVRVAFSFSSCVVVFNNNYERCSFDNDVAIDSWSFASVI